MGSFQKENPHEKKKHVELEHPNQDMIQTFFESLTDEKDVQGHCTKQEYIYQTLDEQKRRMLLYYTKILLEDINKKAKEFFEKRGELPYHFEFLEFIYATSKMNQQGHVRWVVNIMVEETTLHYSQRLQIDFTIHIQPIQNIQHTCAEYTTFPFPKYFLGYPTYDQMIPLPSQVIVSAGDVLAPNPPDRTTPALKSYHLNSVKLFHSDLALGTGILQKSLSRPDYTSLESSKAQKHVTANNINNDFVNNFNLKPLSWKQGHFENGYHYIPQTETFFQSKLTKVPDGYIQPAIWRNKWPKLPNEPKDNIPTLVNTPLYWNDVGASVLKNKSYGHRLSNQYSTSNQHKYPIINPTIWGLPLNAGPNYWLFENTSGLQAQAFNRVTL